MEFSSSVVHGGNISKVCLWDPRNHRIASASRFMVMNGSATRFMKNGEIVVSGITSVTGTNILVRKPDCVPSLEFRVFQGNSSMGDISGDDQNLEFVGARFLELWVLVQKGMKELEVVRSIALKDKEATALNDLAKESVRNATVAFSLAVKELQDLQEAFEAEVNDTSEVSAMNNIKDALASFSDLFELLDVLREADGSLGVLREADACVNQTKNALKTALKSIFGSKPQKIEKKELPSLYKKALNLQTLCLLVHAAEDELKHAREIRSYVEEIMDTSCIVDVIRHDETLAWEKKASKRLGEANEALKRLEDSYFGNI